MYEEVLGLVFRFVLSTNGFEGLLDLRGGDGEEDVSMSWLSIEGGCWTVVRTQTNLRRFSFLELGFEIQPGNQNIYQVSSRY